MSSLLLQSSFFFLQEMSLNVFSREGNACLYIYMYKSVDAHADWLMYQMCLDHSLPLNQRSDIPPPAYYCSECAEKVGQTLSSLDCAKNSGFPKRYSSVS